MRPAGSKHARDLGKRSVVVEPVERLGRRRRHPPTRPGAASLPRFRPAREASGTAASSSARISSSGSIAVTRWPRATSARVSFPCLRRDRRRRAARRRRATEPPLGIARATPRSYAPATSANAVQAAHPGIAVDDHRAESRQALDQCRLDQAGDPRSERDLRGVLAHARRAEATTSRTLSRAQRRDVLLELRARSPGGCGPLFEARNASSAPLHVDASRAAATAASVRSHARSSTMRPATKASSSASAPWTPAQTTTTSVVGVA